MGVYARKMKQYNCPKELVAFIEYMAITKRYVSDNGALTGWKDSCLYQHNFIDSYEKVTDVRKELNWRFNDFCNFERGQEYIVKTLPDEGVSRVMWGLSLCFQSAKVQAAMSDWLYKGA